VLEGGTQTGVVGGCRVSSWLPHEHVSIAEREPHYIVVSRSILEPSNNILLALLPKVHRLIVGKQLHFGSRCAPTEPPLLQTGQSITIFKLQKFKSAKSDVHHAYERARPTGNPVKLGRGNQVQCCNGRIELGLLRHQLVLPSNSAKSGCLATDHKISM
jgi:hypothetical protein